MRIAVLVSGGVDSAVVVDRLYKEGHDLTLFYIRIGNDNGEGDCSADEDIEMCTLIARKYGLPLRVVSLHEEYWDSVMAYALRTVREGRTPHPDMMCNKLIKFGYFEQRWGHEFDKTATRKDSQGICFLGKIDYADFIERHLGTRPGPVIEIETGRKIGEHRGYWFYTIGQRKGLGLSGGPWFVVRKNVRDNVIYVSRGYDTPRQYGRVINLQEMHWISGDPGLEQVAFKTRHSPEFHQGRLERHDDGSLTIRSEQDIQGIAPGQFAIIYSPDCRLCFGSGLIS